MLGLIEKLNKAIEESAFNKITGRKTNDKPMDGGFKAFHENGKLNENKQYKNGEIVDNKQYKNGEKQDMVKKCRECGQYITRYFVVNVLDGSYTCCFCVNKMRVQEMK